MVYGADVTFSDGSTGRNMRNNYPKEYIKAYYEFAQQNKGITFSRSGYTGAQTYPAHWAGDERSTFEAFKRQLIAGINSGMSGVLFWGWDLGDSMVIFLAQNYLCVQLQWLLFVQLCSIMRKVKGNLIKIERHGI